MKTSYIGTDGRWLANEGLGRTVDRADVSRKRNSKRNKINMLAHFLAFQIAHLVGKLARDSSRKRSTVTHPDVGELSSTALALLRDHGPLLSAANTAKLMAFESTDALRQARIRQRLPIDMFTIAGRRGWFASTRAVADWIDTTIGACGAKATGQGVLDDSRRNVSAKSVCLCACDRRY